MSTITLLLTAAVLAVGSGRGPQQGEAAHRRRRPTFRSRSDEVGEPVSEPAPDGPEVPQEEDGFDRERSRELDPDEDGVYRVTRVVVETEDGEDLVVE